MQRTVRDVYPSTSRVQRLPDRAVRASPDFTALVNSPSSPCKQLSDCRTSKRVRLKKGTRYYRATGCRVTSTKQKFDTLRGESMQYCGISCHIRSSLTAETSRSGYSSLTVPATLPPHAGRLPAAVAARGVHQRGREVESAWLRPARRCVATAPWQECGEELAEREQQMAKVC